MPSRPPRRSAGLVALASLAATLTGAAVAAPAATAASPTVCSGGGFALVLPGSTLKAPPGGEIRTEVAASRLGSSFVLKGKYVEFTVTPSTFGLTDYTLTGAANPADMTGGTRTAIWASKTPDHRGATLSGPLEVRLRDSDVVIEREDGDLSMKIQAKDCAQGGIFQMEPEREDGTATVITHRLAPGTFYYDNPRFRARLGTTVPFVTSTGQTIQMPVPTRVNFGNRYATGVVGRDSAQLATRVDQCHNAFGTHCGGVSTWRVTSGGRMGQVLGEDAVEVSPASTDCASDCQAQNRIRGRATVLGFPRPVPASSLLTAREP